MGKKAAFREARYLRAGNIESEARTQPNENALKLIPPDRFLLYDDADRKLLTPEQRIIEYLEDPPSLGEPNKVAVMLSTRMWRALKEDPHLLATARCTICSQGMAGLILACECRCHGVHVYQECLNDLNQGADNLLECLGGTCHSYTKPLHTYWLVMTSQEREARRKRQRGDDRARRTRDRKTDPIAREKERARLRRRRLKHKETQHGNSSDAE
ncbi:hypothetical protein C8R46DRAFT_1030682 [Mycena filopes]|nr:hypothetical protein C8R46DRAFT_1030682 [Mycena filopes]